MPTNNPNLRFILVDTNCFLRLYHSPMLPLMGEDIGGYKLLTLKKLIDEFKNNQVLMVDYPSVASGAKHDDLINSTLKLSGINIKLIKKQCDDINLYAKSFLESYCKREKIQNIRRLSIPDIELLATTIVLKGILATDEWPLRLVAKDLMEDPEEYKIDLYNSLELLYLMEMNGKLNPEERRRTVRSWVLSREKLLRDWQKDYQRLFGESADTLDDV